VPDGPYEIADLGRDVLALLDRLGLARVHFCGLSLGGMTGMWLAANASDRVDRLVLLCTSPLLGPASGWTDRAATVRAHGTAAVAATVVSRWLTPSYAAAHPDLVAQLVAMVSATPAAGYAACCEAVAGMDLQADLPRIAAPTLVIAGEQDPAAPPEHARAIVAAVPDSRLEILSPAAHLVTAERPDEVLRLIGGHLDGGRP
jgi:3-oxoadipate enol-lactonase